MSPLILFNIIVSASVCIARIVASVIRIMYVQMVTKLNETGEVREVDVHMYMFCISIGWTL